MKCSSVKTRDPEPGYSLVFMHFVMCFKLWLTAIYSYILIVNEASHMSDSDFMRVVLCIHWT